MFFIQIYSHSGSLHSRASKPDLKTAELQAVSSGSSRDQRHQRRILQIGTFAQWQVQEAQVLRSCLQTEMCQVQTLKYIPIPPASSLLIFLVQGRKRINNFSGRETIEINIDGRINFDMLAVIQKDIDRVVGNFQSIILWFLNCVIQYQGSGQV